MEVIVLPGPGEVGEVAARRVVAVLGPRRPGVLGVATGSSPLAAYRALCTWQLAALGERVTDQSQTSPTASAGD